MQNGVKQGPARGIVSLVLFDVYIDDMQARSKGGLERSDDPPPVAKRSTFSPIVRVDLPCTFEL